MFELSVKLPCLPSTYNSLKEAKFYAEFKILISVKKKVIARCIVQFRRQFVQRS